MKPKNAGKDMWLRAQTVYQKLKQKVQLQDADSIDAFSVLYMTQSLNFMEGGVGAEPSAPHVSAEAPALDTHHFKTQIV